jgi:hypothetical protein
MCSVLDSIRYAAYRQRELPRACRISSQHSTYPTSPSSQHYLSSTISPKHSTSYQLFDCEYITVSFCWIHRDFNNNNNYDGGFTYVTIPASIRPSQINPHPAFAFPSFSRNLHPLCPCFLPFLVSDRPQIPAQKQPGGSLLPRHPFIFSEIGRHTPEFIVLAIWFMLALGWGYRRWHWVFYKLASVRSPTSRPTYGNLPLIY